jgi:recombinational DNA repair protein RecR
VGAIDNVRYAYLRGTALRLSWLAGSLPDLPDVGTRTAWSAAVALLAQWRDEARELASPP